MKIQNLKPYSKGLIDVRDVVEGVLREITTGGVGHAVKDPEELNNCYGQPEYASIQLELERKILAWYQRTSDVVPIERQSRNYESAVRQAHGKPST